MVALKNYYVILNGKTSVMRAKSDKAIKKRVGKTALALGAYIRRIIK